MSTEANPASAFRHNYSRDFTKAMRMFSGAGAHLLQRNACAREPIMKPLWTQTIAWIAAVVAAVLLAFANPVGLGFFTDGHAYRPHGGITPR
jgi:hypothetical protein